MRNFIERRGQLKDYEQKEFRSGYVSIIGRPNVGKSTLLNCILHEKVAIVTAKPQTTRNRIVGIKNISNAQIIFIDTPGIHKPKHKLGETMVKTSLESLEGVDIVLFLVEPREPGKDDHSILAMVRKVKATVILVINKIDTIRKEILLPLIDYFQTAYHFNEIIPVSALKSDGIELLIRAIARNLPQGPRYYPDDMITDQIERFMVSELIREKVMAVTREEVPHSIAVDIIEWNERKDGLIEICAHIYVERDSQKAIIIGKQGAMLKSIGMSARSEIEKLLHARVFLEIWAKVKKHWRNDPRILKELGYL